MKKKHKIVMLPTTEVAHLQLSKTNLIYYSIERVSNLFKPQHLYIISSELIKEGDWYIMDLSKVMKCENGESEVDYCNDNSNCKKIIVTTNKSLKIVKTTNYVNGFDKGEIIIPPQLPISFIKAYAEAGGIDEVMLEYEEVNIYKLKQGEKLSDFVDNPDEYQLKLNDDNTVICSLDELTVKGTLDLHLINY